MCRWSSFPRPAGKLYEYHPDKAKQLLAEAGYPNGFKFTAVLYQDHVDMASIYKDYLAKVGVELELDVREFGVYAAMARSWPKQYKEAVFGDQIAYPVLDGTNLTPGAGANYPVINDPVINEYRAKLTSFKLMQNQAERDRLARELCLYLISQSYLITPPAYYEYEMWSPWVKHMCGMNMGTSDYIGATEFLWIDQGLKEKTVGRR